ncbi:MAG: hypothetical protein J1E40_01150 [Oscillospiraceae bacterium]|nr:hypothetical protein [Oscillospiraceae bacterium]
MKIKKHAAIAATVSMALNLSACNFSVDDNMASGAYGPPLEDWNYESSTETEADTEDNNSETVSETEPDDSSDTSDEDTSDTDTENENTEEEASESTDTEEEGQ